MGRWLAVAIVLGAIAAVAADAPSPDAEQAEAPAESRPAGERSRVSREDATAIVRQAYGGRVVSVAPAQARPSPGREKERGFRVRVDVEGRVKTVFVDGRGRIHEDARF